MYILKYKRLCSSILLTALLTSSAAGADNVFCKKYAQKAVGQYYIAKFHHMPDIEPPAWQEDYDAHKKWCELPFITGEMADNETAKRDEYIRKHYSAVKETDVNSEKTILPGGKVKIRQKDGKVTEYAIIKHKSINEKRDIGFYMNVPLADKPAKLLNDMKEIYSWLDKHAEVLLDIVSLQVSDEKALKNYMDFEGDDSSVFQKIDTRSQAIKYLILP